MKWLKKLGALALAALAALAYSQKRRVDDLQDENADLTADVRQASLVAEQREQLTKDLQRENAVRSRLSNRAAVANSLRKTTVEVIPDEKSKDTTPNRRRASSFLRRKVRS